MKNQERRELAKKLHSDTFGKGKLSAKDFAKWAKVRGLKYLSTSTISNIGKYSIDEIKEVELKLPSITTIKSFIVNIPNFIDEYEKGENEEEIAAKKSTIKLNLFLDKTYFLYYFHRENESSIGRAILKIGSTSDEVYVENVRDGVSSDYRGSISISIQSLDYLIVGLSSDLRIIFRIPTQERDVTDYLVGGYLNINSGIVLGTIIASLVKDNVKGDDLKPLAILPNSSEYKSLDKEVKFFLRKKSRNFIKLPISGIFTIPEFDAFLKKQNIKLPNRDHVINEGNVFISCPVSDIAPQEFEQLNHIIKNNILPHIRETFNVDVFYVGEYWTNQNDTNHRNIMVKKNLEVLRRSDRFFLIFPEKISSGSLVELGFALSDYKSCTIFCRNKKDLPFVVQNLNFYSSLVHFFTYTDNENLVEEVKKLGNNLFKI